MARKEIFQKVAEAAVKKHPTVYVVIWVVFLAMMIVSSILMAQDYWTSKVGYESLPIRAGWTITTWAVAAAPQLGQIAFGYVVMALGPDGDKTNNGWVVLSALIWLVLMIVDVYTDIVFFAGVNPTQSITTTEITLTAIVNSVITFTLLSEVMWVFGFGVSLRLFPGSLVRVKAGLAEALLALSSNTPEEFEEKKKNGNGKRQKPNTQNKRNVGQKRSGSQRGNNNRNKGKRNNNPQHGRKNKGLPPGMGQPPGRSQPSGNAGRPRISPNLAERAGISQVFED